MNLKTTTILIAASIALVAMDGASAQATQNLDDTLREYLRDLEEWTERNIENQTDGCRFYPRAEFAVCYVGVRLCAAPSTRNLIYNYPILGECRYGHWEDPTPSEIVDEAKPLIANTLTLVLLVFDDATQRASDALGQNICGRSATQLVIGLHHALGHCTSQSTWEPPSATDIIQPVIWTIFWTADFVVAVAFFALDLALGTVDHDGDRIPDALEPTICFIEDKNTDLDGSCSGSDYHP